MKQQYGYVRVSSKEQHEQRQIKALQDMKIPDSHIFIDKQSGKNFQRQAYQKLMRTGWGEIIKKFRNNGAF